MNNSSSIIKNNHKTDKNFQTPASSRIESSKYKFYIKEEAKGNQLSTSQAIFEELKDLANADQESLWVIYVNTKNRIIGKDLVSLGGIDSASVDMKILFRRILLNNATAFFIAHNHPSGDTAPSAGDIEVTANIKKASEMLQVKLLDHLIIGAGSYYSFNSNGYL